MKWAVVQDSEIDMKRDAEGKEIMWRGKQNGESGGYISQSMSGERKEAGWSTVKT